jgi:hypothetical protein
LIERKNELEEVAFAQRKSATPALGKLIGQTVLGAMGPSSESCSCIGSTTSKKERVALKIEKYSTKGASS